MILSLFFQAFSPLVVFEISFFILHIQGGGGDVLVYYLDIDVCVELKIYVTGLLHDVSVKEPSSCYQVPSQEKLG